MVNHDDQSMFPNKAKHPLHEVTPNLLRRMNERRILEAVQSKGALSRAALVRQTGISPPTVSKLVRSLIEARLLEEGDFLGPAPGRPARVLRLANAGVWIFGGVIDTDECTIAATGLEGDMHDERIVRFPTPQTYDELIAEIVKHSKQLIPRRDKSGTLAMGLSVPALIDRRQQQVLLSSNLHFLDGRFLASDLQKRLGFRTILLHDTDALCLGQRTFGAARGMDDFALVDATAGFGGAMMIGGQLLSGHSGMAGEIGHITVEPNGRLCGCGNIGCLETVGNDTALAARISEKLGKPVDIQSVIEMAQAGKLDADAEIRQTIDYLAIGVAAVVNIFNPAAVFVQARMFDIRDGLFELLLEAVARRALGPSLAGCQVLRSSGTKLHAAVAGTIHHLTTVLRPRV